MILRRFEMYSFAGPDEAIAGFAQAARECARYIPEVLFSATGRIEGAPPLNFAWEQAYASPESYRRYMEHPYHAAKLDRYLMIDSPECILTGNNLGVGLIGYRADPDEFFLAEGARRVIAMQLRPGAEAAFAALAQANHGQDGMVVSVFRDNWFGARWFDAESVVDPNPMHTHIWEQGFASIAAARANTAGWRAQAEQMTDMMVEMVYEIEPGEAYENSMPR
jgi:hypothetical protein